jgi:hypothetical protein
MSKSIKFLGFKTCLKTTGHWTFAPVRYINEFAHLMLMNSAGNDSPPFNFPSNFFKRGEQDGFEQ